jgi:hypothetical protein
LVKLLRRKGSLAKGPQKDLQRVQALGYSDGQVPQFLSNHLCSQTLLGFDPESGSNRAAKGPPFRLRTMVTLIFLRRKEMLGFALALSRTTPSHIEYSQKAGTDDISAGRGTQMV